MALAGALRVATLAHDFLREVRVRLVPGGALKVRRERDRWLVVTVEGHAAEEITGRGELPAPLAELGDSVEVRIQRGPGRWGTEIAARPGPTRSVAVGDGEARERLRAALRKSKQLLEVGEILLAEPRPEGRRPATVAGRLVDHAERHADEGGVL